MFRHEIVKSDKWCFRNGREIYADVEIKTGNAGAAMDFRVKAWQSEKFVEVLDSSLKNLPGRRNLMRF